MIAGAPTDSAAEVARTINAAEARVRAAEPVARVIFLEPDIYVEPAVATTSAPTAES